MMDDLEKGQGPGSPTGGVGGIRGVHGLVRPLKYEACEGL